MATKKKTEVVDQQAAEEVIEVIPDPSEHPAAPASIVNIVVAREGDSYASLAVQNLPDGADAHKFAQELYDLNSGAVIYPGTKIQIHK